MILARRSLALLALGAAPLAAQPLTRAETTAVNAVFARFTDRTPGCALGVRRGGQLVFARGYGLASLELGVPITSRTVFDIGSTSKQITAASIALLSLDGKLSLDDDIRKFVPELPDLGSVVTLRHMLTHTSGWRDYIDVMGFEGWDDRDHTTDADALAALVRQRALNFPPGSQYRYSNTGYFLMSVVVQRVTGQSLAAFAKARFFDPLGMTHTHYLTDSREVIPGKASAYEPSGPNAWRVAMSNWEQIGDGGVQTTVEDLAKWEANLGTGTVGGRALTDLLITPYRLTSGAPAGYGLGLALDTYRGVARVQHGGAWGGYRAMLMRYPMQGLGIVLECNVADANTGRLAEGVSDALLPAASLAARATPAPRPTPPRPGRLAHPLSDYAGTYASAEVGTELTVVAGDSALRVTPRRGETATLRFVEGERFAGPGHVVFIRDAAGRVVALTVTTRGLEAVRFERTR